MPSSGLIFGSFSSNENERKGSYGKMISRLRYFAIAQHDIGYWHLDTIPSESLDVTMDTDYPPLAAKDDVLQRPLPGREDRSRYTLRALDLTRRTENNARWPRRTIGSGSRAMG